MNGKRFILVLLSLWYTKCFSFVYFPFDDKYFGQLSHIIEFCLFLYIINGKITKNALFGKDVLLLSSTMFMSIIPSSILLNTNPLLYMIQSSFFVIPMFYFVFADDKYTRDDILKPVLTLGCIYCIIRIIEQYTYPTLLFIDSTRYNEYTGELPQRNNLWRITMFGYEFSVVFLYYVFEKFKDNKNSLFLVLLIMGCVSLYLGLGRMSYLMAFVAFVLIYIGQNIDWKVVIKILFVICLVYFIINNLEMILGRDFYEQTTSDVADDDYIRNYAYSYYFSQTISNPLFFLFGHGVSVPNSEYAKLITYMESTMRFFRSDIGVVGQLYMYGLCNVIAFIAFLIRLIRASSKYSYLFAYFVTVTMAFAIIPIIFSRDQLL